MERPVAFEPQNEGPNEEPSASQTKADIFDIKTGSKIDPTAEAEEVKNFSEEELQTIIENNFAEAMQLAVTSPSRESEARVASTTAEFITNVKNGIETSSDPQNLNTQLSAVVYALKKAGFSEAAKKEPQD